MEMKFQLVDESHLNRSQFWHHVELWLIQSSKRLWWPKIRRRKNVPSAKGKTSAAVTLKSGRKMRVKMHLAMSWCQNTSMIQLSVLTVNSTSLRIPSFLDSAGTRTKILAAGTTEDSIRKSLRKSRRSAPESHRLTAMTSSVASQGAQRPVSGKLWLARSNKMRADQFHLNRVWASSKLSLKSRPSRRRRLTLLKNSSSSMTCLKLLEIWLNPKALKNLKSILTS